MGKTTRLISGVAAVSLSAVTFAGTAMATTDSSSTAGIKDVSEGSTKAVRIAGLYRYDTAIEASKSMERAGVVKKGGVVYVAGGTAYADSLAVTPLADCMNAPVLLTPASGMFAHTMDYIKSLQPSKVVVLGDGASVDSKFEASLVATGAVTRDKVERVAGPTRYETAYKIAAETLACESGVGGTKIADAKKQLQTDTFAEADYQTALSNWNTARANKVEADNAVDTAQDKLDALVKQQSALAAKLQAVGNVTEQQEIVKNLTNEYAKLQSQVDAAASTLGVFVNLLGAQPGQGATTLDINSTLAEYIAKFPAQAAAINAAIKEVGGISTATTLNDAIAQAKAHLEEKQAALGTTAQELAQAQAAIMAAAAANAANQPVLAEMGKLQVQINAAKAALAAAQKAAENADAALNTATEALSNATTKRPAPNAIAKDQAALAKAYDATVADPASGSHPIFLATGLSSNNALVAGPAAANNGKYSGKGNSADGVVMLSRGSALDTWTQKYISLSKAQVVAVGAQASAAIGTNATLKFNSSDDYLVAEQVANKYFHNHKGTPVAVASGEQAADAVIGSSYISQFDGGLILAKRSGLPTPSFNCLAFDLDSGDDHPLASVRAFGDGTWITDQVIKDIKKASTL